MDQVRRHPVGALRRAPGDPINLGAIHRAVLAGFATQIGVRSEERESREYRGPRGLRFQISPGSVLARQSPPWVVAAELVETTRLYARAVGRIRPDWIERVAPHLVQREWFEPHWLPETGQVAAWEKVSLHGLTLVPRRRVPFGPVDPKAARDIFIQSALVEEQIRTQGEFLRHNRELIEELEQIEAKKRSRDVLVDLKARFDFYDARVPADIHSTPSFEKWRKEAERGRPRLLFMSREDLLRPGAGPLPDQDFPDTIEVGGLRLPLDYRHEPGEPDDGVTVTAPLAAIGQLSAERLEWLVPGMLREKLVALLRTLPKRLRVRFVPATEFAEGAAESMPFASGALTERFAEYLRRLTGTPLSASDWQLSELPEHLRMNVRVLGPDGAQVAMGRDLAELRRRLLTQARESLDQAAVEVNGATTGDRPRGRTAPAAPRAAEADARRPAPLPTTPKRMTAFEPEFLPEVVELDQGGMAVQAYPALADVGDAVTLRLFATPQAAGEAMRGGVRRLLALAARDEIRPMLDFLPAPDGTPGIDALRLLHAPLGPGDALERALIDRIAERAFLAGGVGDQAQERAAAVRTPAAFAAMLDAGRPRLWEAGQEVVGLVWRILEARQELWKAIEAPLPSTWEAAVADLREQLTHLLPQGFLTDVPWERLVHYPRYLAAARARLQKLRESGHLRDARLQAEVRTHWKRWLAEASGTERGDGGPRPELTRYRWLIEEFRVSLFAQELRTAEPVSAVRLERQWERVRREAS